MVVAVFAVLTMDVAIDDVIDVTPMRQRFVAATDAVHVRGIVRIAGVPRTIDRVGRRHGELMFVDVIAVDVVQVAIMNVVDVVVVTDPEVAALGAVLMAVPIVNMIFHCAFLTSVSRLDDRVRSRSKSAIIARSRATLKSRRLRSSAELTACGLRSLHIRTCGARTVKREVVVRALEAARQPRVHRGAAFEFVHARALRARKVVVMLFTGDFIERVSSGHVDDREPPVFEKSTNGSVNGCQTESAAHTLSRSVNFLRRERPGRTFERLADR